MILNTAIPLRKGTAEAWEQINPILGKDEPGLEKETNRIKVGDGKHTWNELAYFYGDFKITKTKKGTYITFLDDNDITLTNTHTTAIPEIIIQNVEQLVPHEQIIEVPADDLKVLLQKKKRKRKKG